MFLLCSNLLLLKKIGNFAITEMLLNQAGEDVKQTKPLVVVF